MKQKPTRGLSNLPQCWEMHCFVGRGLAECRPADSRAKREKRCTCYVVLWLLILVSKADLSPAISHQTETFKIPPSFTSWIDEREELSRNPRENLARNEISTSETKTKQTQAEQTGVSRPFLRIRLNKTWPNKTCFFKSSIFGISRMAVSSVFPCLVQSVSVQLQLLAVLKWFHFNRLFVTRWRSFGNILCPDVLVHRWIKLMNILNHCKIVW